MAELRKLLSNLLIGLVLAWVTISVAAAAEKTAETSPVPSATEITRPRPAPPAPTVAELFKTLLSNKKPNRRLTTREQLVKALLSDDFRYDSKVLTDPFIPFILKEEAPEPEFTLPKEEEVEAPKPQLPLTPLQKMSIGEVESGLKAILVGPMGRKALIEDNAGRGYIVAVGTPITGNDGIITDIFTDGLVIRQEIWDRKQKRYIPKKILIKLKKEEKK